MRVLRRAIGSLLAVALPAVLLTGSVAAQDGATNSSAASPASSAPLVPMSACELLDEDAIGEILGVENVFDEDAGMLQDDAGWLSTCGYRADPELAFLVLTVTLGSGPGSADAFADLRIQPDAIPVDSLGDEAVLHLPEVWGFAQPVGSLEVRTGDDLLGLSLGVVGIDHEGTLLQVGDGGVQRDVLTRLATLGLDAIRIAAAPVPPLCDLLSVDEAAALVGRDLVSAALVARNDDWGPACHYRDAAEDARLIVGVTSGPDAVARFETCAVDGRPQPGVGEAAIIGLGIRCGAVFAGTFFIEEPLLVRAGETILVVAAVTQDQPTVNQLGSPEAQVVVARRILEGLGLDPGAAPATSVPIDPGLLTEPCRLLSTDEVADILGVAITAATDQPGDATSPIAGCQYDAANGMVLPLTITLILGDAGRDEWAYQADRSSGAQPVDGLGDGAVWAAVDNGSGLDQPLVSVWVRTGDAVIRLGAGPTLDPTDFTLRALGTPEEQLALLRSLAELLLPRLVG